MLRANIGWLLSNRELDWREGGTGKLWIILKFLLPDHSLLSCTLNLDFFFLF